MAHAEYRIELPRSVLAQMKGLPKRALGRIRQRIDALARDPRPMGVEKLTGHDDLYRVRVGDYRIIYTIRDNELLVLVLAAGHRRDVYRGY